VEVSFGMGWSANSVERPGAIASEDHDHGRKSLTEKPIGSNPMVQKLSVVN
jgi:hypothetical protein